MTGWRKRTIMQMAQEAGFNLEQGFLLRVTGIDEDLEAFAKLVREDALAQPAPVQEPVAIRQFRKRGCADWYDGYADHQDGGGPYEERTVCTTPPAAQRTWVGLTQDERINIAYKANGNEVVAVELTEAKLKELNHD